MANCCKRWFCRLYYALMAVVYLIILAIQLITLGTFGVQFTRTNSFHGTHSDTSAVCVLYGKSMDPSSLFNVVLTNSASCGFTFWGIVTIVLVLLVWMALHVVLAIIGKPKITSLFRIADLIVTGSMAVLSLIISAVITAGLKQTCNNIAPTTTRCSDKKIMYSDNSLSFYPNLNTAMNTSWVVTVAFLVLATWYTITLFMSCCLRKCRKGQEDETTDGNFKTKNPDEDEKELTT